jgi:hypothetical protein
MFEEMTEETGDRTTAMILGVELGAVIYEETLGGGTVARGQRTLKLEIEPADSDPYEAELTLGPEESMVPVRPGTRLPVLVDPLDPYRVALPQFNRWFALPGGIVWQPPAAPEAAAGFDTAVLRTAA